MSRLELLAVCASLDPPAVRGFLERLSRRYLLEVATVSPVHADGGGDELEVRAFAAATPPQERPGALGDALARAHARGPWTPELFEFLHHQHARYRAIAFVSYVSPLTAFGLPLVPERAILLPFADAEDRLADPPYRALFHLPRAIGYRDAAERDRIQSAARNAQVPYELLGVEADGDDAFDRLVAVAVHA
jgi:hypothetical protein